MTLLSELIDIPEQVHQGDFVLRLTEGVGRADETLDNYVVTPQLARCFNDALGFIRGALQSRFEVSTEGVNAHAQRGQRGDVLRDAERRDRERSDRAVFQRIGESFSIYPRGPG